jgi:hypothetical protein
MADPLMIVVGALILCGLIAIVGSLIWLAFG